MKIPSYKASIFAGAVFMPVFYMFLNFLEKHYKSYDHLSFTLFVLSILFFVLPFSLSTVEFKYFKKKYGSYLHIFKLHGAKDDFKEFLIPTWKRIIVWFLSASVSMIIVNIIADYV